MLKRTVFYISDGTGITVVGLGRSLLAQRRGLLVGTTSGIGELGLHALERVEVLVALGDEGHDGFLAHLDRGRRFVRRLGRPAIDGIIEPHMASDKPGENKYFRQKVRADIKAGEPIFTRQVGGVGATLTVE